MSETFQRLRLIVLNFSCAPSFRGLLRKNAMKRKALTEKINTGLLLDTYNGIISSHPFFRLFPESQDQTPRSKTPPAASIELIRLNIHIRVYRSVHSLADPRALFCLPTFSPVNFFVLPKIHARSVALRHARRA